MFGIERSSPLTPDSDIDLRVASLADVARNELLHLAADTSVSTQVQEAAFSSAVDLTMIKSDAKEEFLGAQDMYSTLHPYRYMLSLIMAGDLENKSNHITLNQLPLKLNVRQIIFLNLTNLFNRVDQIIEERTAESEGAQIELDNVFNSRLPKYMGGMLSPRAMLENIKILANYFEIPTSVWNKKIPLIFDAQRQGMSWVAQSKREGAPTYSIQDALWYRRQTILNYSQILSPLVSDSRYEQRKIEKTFMMVQFTDDEEDIWEDAETQVNPFVALLTKHNLLDDYMDWEPESDSKDDLNCFLIDHADINLLQYISIMRQISMLPLGYGYAI